MSVLVLGLSLGVDLLDVCLKFSCNETGTFKGRDTLYHIGQDCPSFIETEKVYNA